MLEHLFSSRSRAQLCTLFFSAPGQEYWLREAARAVGMNVNAVRREMVRLEDAGILIGRKRGNQRVFRANVDHPFYPELVSMVRKEHLAGVCTPAVPDEFPPGESEDARARARRGVCYRVDTI